LGLPALLPAGVGGPEVGTASQRIDKVRPVAVVHDLARIVAGEEYERAQGIVDIRVLELHPNHAEVHRAAKTGVRMLEQMAHVGHQQLGASHHPHVGG